MRLGIVRNSAAALAACITLGCGGGSEGPPTGGDPVPATVDLTVSAAGPMVSFGDTRTLTAVVKDAGGATIPGASVSWTASPSGMVSLLPATGLSTTATATGNGTTTVTATSGSATKTQSLTIGQVFAAITLEPPAATVNVAATRQLTATPRDARGNGMTVGGTTFRSTNDAVATVSTSGLVTGNAAGAASIIAELTSGVFKADTTAITVVTSSFPTTASVSATNSLQFVPPSVEVSRNTSGFARVTWDFGSISHNVTFTTPGSPAGLSDRSNTSASIDFTAPNTYNYHCTIHPTQMTGSVIVH